MATVDNFSVVEIVYTVQNSDKYWKYASGEKWGNVEKLSSSGAFWLALEKVNRLLAIERLLSI